MCTHSVFKVITDYTTTIMMSLRDLCFCTLRDSGIPLQVSDQLTDGRRFDQSCQILRLVNQEIWTSYKQEVGRGCASYTNDGMDSFLLDIRQLIRTRYQTNSPVVFEVTPSLEAAGYEVPRTRPNSGNSCDTWGYANNK